MMLLLIIFSTFGYSQASVWDNLTANIAVVEYGPALRESFQDEFSFITDNIAKFTNMIKIISNEMNLDMIIFPEATIQSNISSAIEIVVNSPYNSTGFNIKSMLGAVARTYKTYMVVNVMERSKCEESDQSKSCKDYGFHFYSTDMILDREATIINKYRKYNLFGQNLLEKPENPDQVVIETDFGVNFGILTGFDLLFKNPAQDLLKRNVDGVILPGVWISELPFLTALQTQQMWSQKHDVTLFAAGTNYPFAGSGGTGIYRGSKGIVASTIIAEGGSQPFVYESLNGEIPPKEFQDLDVIAKRMDSFRIWRDNSIGDYKNMVLNIPATDIEAHLCYENGTENKICCDFTIKLSKTEPRPNMNFYTYHLVAYSGVRSFSGLYNLGAEFCGIIACLNSTLTSCGQRFPKYEEVDWPVTFEEITIKANFEKSENKTQFPNSLLSSIRPIDATKTTWTSEDVEEGGESLVQRTFSITEKQNRLLTFAIYGRKFEQDFAPPNNDDDDDDNNDDNNENNDNGSGKGTGNRIWGHNVWILFTCYIFLSRFMTK